MPPIKHPSPIEAFGSLFLRAAEQQRIAQNPATYVTPDDLSRRIVALAGDARHSEGEARHLICADIAAAAARLALDAKSPEAVDALLSQHWQQRQEAVCAAVKVTPAMVDAEIADEDYHVPNGTTLTICTLTLANGYTVTGESACADPANFDIELGRDLAKGKAREKIFGLLAFRLRDEICSQQRRRSQAREVLKASATTHKDPLINSILTENGA